MELNFVFYVNLKADQKVWIHAVLEMRIGSDIAFSDYVVKVSQPA